MGVRYLSEGNYDEAIIAFTAAIEIDPKSVDTYIGLAKAYAGQGEIHKAIEILSAGYEETGSGELADMAEELGGKWARPDAPFMPNVVGRDLQDVRDELEKMGAKVTVEHRFDDEIPADKVIDTSIEAGGKFGTDGAVVLTVSDGPEKEFDDFIYDVAGRGLMYIHAGGLTDDFGRDNLSTRYDADGDGELDWIVYCAHCVAVITERDGVFSLHAVDTSNHRLDIFKDCRSGGLVFETTWSSAYTRTTYNGFENGSFLELAYGFTRYDWYEDEMLEEEYRIKGVPVDRDVYEGYLGTLIKDGAVYSNADPLNGPYIMEPLEGLCAFEEKISNRMLEEIESKLSELPFTTRTYIGDLNGDGVRDVAAIFGTEGESELAGVDYKDDIKINRSWRKQRCGITFCVSEDGLTVSIGDAQTVEDSIWRSEKLAEMDEARSEGTLLNQDGEYGGIFYKNLLVDTPEGIYAYVTLYEDTVLTDEEVRRLEVGDEIKVDEKFSVTVEMLEYSDYQNPHITICDSEYGDYYYLDHIGTGWLLRTYDDMPVMGYAGTTTVLFAKDATVIDDLSWGSGVGESMNRVPNVISLFDSPVLSDAEAMMFTISGGKVTEALLYYRP